MAGCALFVALLSVFPAAAAGPFADGIYMPPGTEKALESEMHPIPQAELEVMLGNPTPHHVFDVYEGQNDALAADAELLQPLRVGVGFSADLDAEAMFGEPGVTPDGATLKYVAAITSTDAVMIRVQVDLSALSPEQTVYVIDPLGPRAYGPYSAEDAIDGGRWLPTIEGDTAVLLARTPDGAAPNVRLVGVSHLYRRMENVKELSCNINVACLTDPALLDVSSGVGIMVRTVLGGDSAVCSGTLINNPDTVGLEPYYITANHCIPGAISAQQADIIWDFRTDACNDDVPPLLSTLPRSNVQSMLATDSSLDITLVQLDAVPSGEFGRSYVGWDTRTPSIGDDVVGIHHPDGAHMRVSFGDVTAIDQPAFGTLPYIKQTEIKWSSGVTEGGSSGSCLLFESDARLFGTLSNGPTHSCTNTINNKDRYASFRAFFPQVEEFLTDVEAGPSIQVSEAVHAFGSEVEPWILEVWNGDNASTLTFSITDVPEWLEVAPTNGQSTGPADVENITITPIPELLAAGLNSASLEISAPGADPRTVIVSAWGDKGIGCSGATPGAGSCGSDIVVLALAVLLMGSVDRRVRA